MLIAFCIFKEVTKLFFLFCMGVYKYVSYAYHMKSFIILVLIVRGSANAHTQWTLPLKSFLHFVYRFINRFPLDCDTIYYLCIFCYEFACNLYP